MKYHVITDTELNNFTSRCQKFIDAGWVPQGGVSVTLDRVTTTMWNDTKRYAQAFVFDGDKTPPNPTEK